MRSTSRRVAVIRRRGWIVAVTVLVATLAGYVVGHRHPPTYVASAYAVVNSGANASGPGDANAASALATTYAGLIPKDSAVIAAVSQTLHAPSEQVRKSIAILTSSSTALLKLNYSASTPARAIAGDKALVLAIAGPTPVSKSIPAGAVVLVSLPTTASASDTTRTLATPLGFLAGLLLGVAILLAWERFDPRIDDTRDLVEALGVPASGELDLTPEGSRALALAWVRAVRRPPALQGQPDPARPSSSEAIEPIKVALVGVGDSGLETAERIRARLDSSGLQDRITAMGGPHEPEPTHPPIRLEVFPSPGTVVNGQLAELEPHWTVLVATRNCTLRELLDASQSMRDFGLDYSWAILAERFDMWSKPPTARLQPSPKPQAAPKVDSRPPAGRPPTASPPANGRPPTVERPQPTRTPATAARPNAASRPTARGAGTSESTATANR